MEDTRIVLIGGTSHVGKSTLGRALAENLGWAYQSTDALARHPGRPWRVGERAVPAHVVHYYAHSTAPELLRSVLAHYRTNVWPIVDAMIQSRLRNDFDHPLVLEGSAVLPEPVRLAGHARVKAVWLCASASVVTDRIRRSSGWESATESDRALIDAFVGRSVAFNQLVQEQATSGDQIVLNADSERLLETVHSLVLCRADCICR